MGTNEPRSSSEVLSRVYDPENDALKTTAQAVIDGVTFDVNLSAAGGDNVAISDGSNVLKINPDGSINTNLAGNLAVDIDAASGDNIKISDGVDTAQVTANGDLKVSDGLRDGGAFGLVSLPTANVPVEAKVGASRVSRRKLLIITMKTSGIYWGLTNGVTTVNGQPTAKGQTLSFSVDPDSNFQIWLVGDANGKNVVITEIP